MHSRRRLKEAVLHGMPLPDAEKDERVVRVVELRGSNVCQVAHADGALSLAQIPTRFRKTVWIRRGNYVIVREAEVGPNRKISCLVEHVLFEDQVKNIRAEGLWPAGFDQPSATTATASEDATTTTTTPTSTTTTTTTATTPAASGATAAAAGGGDESAAAADDDDEASSSAGAAAAATAATATTGRDVMAPATGARRGGANSGVMMMPTADDDLVSSEEDGDDPFGANPNRQRVNWDSSDSEDSDDSSSSDE